MRRPWVLLLCWGCGEAPTYVLLEPPPSPADAGAPIVDGGVIPPDAGVRPLRSDGLACTRDRQCAGGACLQDEPFVGGYCTFLGCRVDDECDRPAGHCVDVSGQSLCAALCEPGDRCREGYRCTDLGRGRVCLPDTQEIDREDGEPCVRDGQCRGGTCFLDPEWPDGHCTTVNCAGLTCANHRGGNAECARVDVAGAPVEWCLRPCERYADCRVGYVCERRFDDGRYCVPDHAPVQRAPASATTLVCGRSQGGTARLAFDVPRGTVSYLATPIAQDGHRLSPHHLELPSGARLDFRGANLFQTTMASLHGYLNPTVIPATPDRAAQLEFGRHVYEVETWSDDVCLWLETERTPGSRVELRVYLTGLASVQARTAPNDPDLAAMFDELGQIYAAAGVAVGPIRYRDVPQPAGTEHRFVDTLEEAEALVALSEPLGAQADPRVINLFLVQGFGPEFPVAGVSLGLPGPAGLHGTSASGVVVSAELLGQPLVGPNGEQLDGSRLTGNVVAHEFGHYLGLFHTTEGDGVTTDPVADTPSCTPDLFPFDCPDLTNLMFPFADPNARELSPGQAFGMMAHPLTKD